MKENKLPNDFFEGSDSLRGFYPMDEQSLNTILGGGFEVETTSNIGIMPTNNDLIS